MPFPIRSAMPDEPGEVAIPLKGVRHDAAVVRKTLGHWLAPRVGARRDLAISPVSTPAGTGVANETLLFEARWNSGGRDHTQGFVARLASERPLYIETAIETHARIYEALADAPGVPVQRVYGYEADPDILGAPFFVMERIEGEVPGDSPHWRTAGFVLEAGPDRRRAMWEDAVRVLAALHQVDTGRFGFLAPAAGASGLGDHLAYWRRSLDHSYGPDGSQHEVLEHGHEWLRDHLPEPAPTAFSWGDARFANIMFRQDRVVAIFDWDTASLAGAEADLAWWRFMDGPASELDGIGGPDDLVVRWQEHTGRMAQNLDWYDTFTLFRLGVILRNLFRNMALDGQLPPDVAAEQGRDSGPARALAHKLGTVE